MDVLERHKVAFVSVTQQFNTSTSMGRLMLNVLLSFAQFEREMISERTRDKIAATRRKGKWTGGMPHAGLRRGRGRRPPARQRGRGRPRARHLRIVPRPPVAAGHGNGTGNAWLDDEALGLDKGREMGGRPLGKNTLFQILTNRIYLGKITYKDEIYDGEHPAIVDAEIFDRAQHLLKRNGRTGGAHVKNRHGALLKGLVRCVTCDCAMAPSHTVKRLSDNGGKVYRYYCCTNAQKRGWQSCPTPSVPAPELERFVVDQVKSIGRDTNLLNETLAECRRQREDAIGKLEVEKRTLERELGRHNADLRKLIGKDSQATDRLADVQERIRTAEQRATEVREQILALSRELVDAREVGEACSLFDPLCSIRSGNDRLCRGGVTEYEHIRRC
jgi:site-specific DNA recombinase